MNPFKRYPRSTAFVFSGFAPIASYLALVLFAGGAAPWVALALIPLLGFGLGMLVSNPTGPVTAGRITVAALIGLSMPWLLLVLFTFGGALLGAPIIAAYAAAVHFGQRVAARKPALTN
ncbi:hypothetical protein [Arenimonas alkanexedens]